MGVAIAIPIGAGLGEIITASAIATGVVVGGAAIDHAVRNNRRSPRFSCKKCGAPHGGCFGKLCPSCHFKQYGDYKPR